MLLKSKRAAAGCAAFILFASLLGVTLPGGVAYADSSLRRGDKGSAVSELQKLLKEHGCYDFDEFTGYFGAATEDGVRKFQALNGLTVDGVAGSDTVAKLKLKKAVKLKDPDSLCLGMSGDKVTEVQQRLKDLGLLSDVTGYFGPSTEAAVTAFQQATGMKADGVVGDKTRETLFAQFKSTTLIPGMKGDNVKKLQQRLTDLGYFDGQVTGLYGQITQNSVEYYQKLNGLSQDGICGKTTYNSIFDKNARTEKEAKRAPEPEVTDTPTYTDTSEQSAHGQEMGQALVDFAKEQLGKKYVYGTEGPNTFDCTGLTCYIYKHFGVTLPRSARSQGDTDYGLKITDISRLMPGDLVFFRHSSGQIGHAGMYVGDGNFIEAPYSGQVVRINPLSKHKGFAFARRVFQ